jgi:hypothetical protein
MMKMVADMGLWRSLITLPASLDANAEWRRLMKKTTGRYARGNISAQDERLLFRNEQQAEGHIAQGIAAGFRRRYKKVAR